MGWYAAKHVGANRDLTSPERHVLLAMAGYADDKGFTFIGQDKIGVEVKKSRETVNRIIASLVRKNCLIKMANKRNRRQRGYQMDFDRIAHGQKIEPPKKPFYSPERVHWFPISASLQNTLNNETSDDTVTHIDLTLGDQHVTHRDERRAENVTETHEKRDEITHAHVTPRSPQSKNNHENDSGDDDLARADEREIAERQERWSRTRSKLKAEQTEHWPQGLSAISLRDDGNLHASLPDAEFAARIIGSDLKSSGFGRIFVRGSSRIIDL